MKPGRVICPDCDVEMDQGFLLDQTHGGRQQTSWVEGEPERSIWVGIKLGGKRRWYARTYRCNRCGALKSYAVDEVQ